MFRPHRRRVTFFFFAKYEAFGHNSAKKVNNETDMEGTLAGTLQLPARHSVQFRTTDIHMLTDISSQKERHFLLVARLREMG